MILKLFYASEDECCNRDSDGHYIHILDKNWFLDSCPLSNSENFMKIYLGLMIETRVIILMILGILRFKSAMMMKLKVQAKDHI